MFSLQAKTELQHLFDRAINDSQQKSCSHWDEMRSQQVLKPFILVNIFNLMQIFSGTYLLVFYAVDILSVMNSGSLDNFLAAVLTACVRFTFTLAASILLAKIGRRTLALISGIGTAASALCLGTILYLHIYCKPDYLTAFFLLLYVAANTVGFMVLPGVMLGELYPARVRGFAGGLTFAIFNITLFGTTKMFPSVRSSIGINGTFWLFGSVSLLASVFLYLMLPETKGKSLSEIEDYFRRSNVLWINRHKVEKNNSKTET